MKIDKREKEQEEILNSLREDDRISDETVDWLIERHRRIYKNKKTIIKMTIISSIITLIFGILYMLSISDICEIISLSILAISFPIAMMGIFVSSILIFKELRGY
ncbi:MAG: hypothetical protein VZS44_10550 [Bacilli bacterium]|nr:hypothetical protein [Bacilli bacterium]